MYELEEQDKMKMQEKHDHHETGELMRQREELKLHLEEQERKKLDVLRMERAERKKYKYMRMEMKEAVRRMKEGARTEGEQGPHEEYEEACFYAPILSLLEESDCVKPSEEELCGSQERCKESLEDAMKPIVQADSLNFGGGRASNGTEEPSPV